MESTINRVALVVSGIDIDTENNFFFNLRHYGFYGCHEALDYGKYSVEFYHHADFKYATSEEKQSIYADAMRFMVECIADGFDVKMVVKKQ